MNRLRIVTFAAACLVGTTGQAATITYASQPAFQAALDGSFTLVNLDAAPLSVFSSGYRLEDPAPAAAFAGLGIDFINFNATVVGGQAFQIPVPGRDRLILNGTFFGGTIAANFAQPVNGVGAQSNINDGGRVRIFSGTNLTGTFLGEFGFSGNSFGGLTSDVAIGSAEFTCDFNSDLACGVFDIQFGTFASGGGVGAVPEPQSWAMMIAGFGLLGAVMRRQRLNTAVAFA